MEPLEHWQQQIPHPENLYRQWLEGENLSDEEMGVIIAHRTHQSLRGAQYDAGHRSRELFRVR